MTIPRSTIGFPVNSVPLNFSFREAFFILGLTVPILCQKLRTVEQWKCCMVGTTQGANYGSTYKLVTPTMESKNGTRPPWKQTVKSLLIEICKCLITSGPCQNKSDKTGSRPSLSTATCLMACFFKGRKENVNFWGKCEFWKPCCRGMWIVRIVCQYPGQ